MNLRVFLLLQCSNHSISLDVIHVRVLGWHKAAQVTYAIGIGTLAIALILAIGNLILRLCKIVFNMGIIIGVLIIITSEFFLVFRVKKPSLIHFIHNSKSSYQEQKTKRNFSPVGLCHPIS